LVLAARMSWARWKSVMLRGYAGLRQRPAAVTNRDRGVEEQAVGDLLGDGGRRRRTLPLPVSLPSPPGCGDVGRL
jgi:hypothetical protein